MERQDDLREAILQAYREATEGQVAAGRAWYPRAGAIIAELAAWSGLDTERTSASRGRTIGFKRGTFPIVASLLAVPMA